MVPDEVKAKKAQIKTIVKNYEAQLEIPDEQDGQAKKKVNDGPQAMDVDGEADGKWYFTKQRDTILIHDISNQRIEHILADKRLVNVANIANIH